MLSKKEKMDAGDASISLEVFNKVYVLGYLLLLRVIRS
jgi:hypothetical protein